MDNGSPTEVETEHTKMGQFLPIRNETQQDIKEATESDDLRTLATLLRACL